MSPCIGTLSLLNCTPLQRASRAGAALAAVLLLLAHGAEAQSGQRVRRGREIVVSAESPDSDTAQRSLSLASLSLPSGLALVRLTADASMAIVGIVRPGGRIGERVPVDQAEISRLCSQITSRNPQISLECEPNFTARFFAVPNDSYFPAQYGLDRIRAQVAWDTATDTQMALVAVIDTGVDYNHVELAENIARNAGEVPGNGIDDDRNGFVDDYLGWSFTAGNGDPYDDVYHGTMCAGIIGASGNNGIGISGVAWKSSILPIKVIGADGYGTFADIAAGIRYATQRGAKVINLSLGSYEPSRVVRKAIRAALVADVVVVVAAGNDANNNDVRPSYPDGYSLDNIISVAATNTNDVLATWSNYGAASVDLAAPGRQIISTYPKDSLSVDDGTSFSAPFVSGAAAMIRSINPLLSFAQVRNILLSSVDTQPSLIGKVATGGRLNMAKAAKIAAGSRAPIVSSPRRLVFDSSRQDARIRLFGSLLTPSNAGVPGIWMTLVCGAAVVDRFKTASNGSYSASMPAPSPGTQCYVADDQLIRSRTITFR